MVQFLLSTMESKFVQIGMRTVCIVLLLITPLWASKKKEHLVEPTPPDLLLEGGRKLHYERSFSSEKEVEASAASLPSWWT